MTPGTCRISDEDAAPGAAVADDAVCEQTDDAAGIVLAGERTVHNGDVPHDAVRDAAEEAEIFLPLDDEATHDAAAAIVDAAERAVVVRSHGRVVVLVSAVGDVGRLEEVRTGVVGDAVVHVGGQVVEIALGGDEVGIVLRAAAVEGRVPGDGDAGVGKGHGEGVACERGAVQGAGQEGVAGGRRAGDEDGGVRGVVGVVGDRNGLGADDGDAVREGEGVEAARAGDVAG